MTLPAGTRVGPYDIIASLGAGGMGEVYRARDARLGRDVAIKILPAVFASDPERLARFEREARTLASLNHPQVQQDGDILSMSATFPRNHANEPARYDMRFTIVYRDVLAEHIYTGDALIEKMYPDQATFKREEQRRFELLLEHTDVPVVVEDVKEWK